MLPDVVRSMLKTRVTPGNISLVLLNLTKKIIFVMFKDSFLQCSRSLHLYFLFSLQITATSCFNFSSLVVPVWLVSWYVIHYSCFMPIRWPLVIFIPGQLLKHPRKGSKLDTFGLGRMTNQNFSSLLPIFVDKIIVHKAHSWKLLMVNPTNLLQLTLL